MPALCFLAFSLLFRLLWPRFRPGSHWLWPVLAFALPFCAGGFHTGTAATLSLVLMAALWEQVRKNRSLRFFVNESTLALILVLAAYCLTPLWAADKGMAIFALPRYLSPVLLALFVMQQKEDSQALWELLPLSGALMTVLSGLALLVPALREYVIVNGRLAGFFQYPNTFAVFLLAGLILQSFRGSKWDLPICALLVMGIVLSGSKTVFVLLVMAVLAIAVIRRQRSTLVILACSLVLALGVGLLADRLALLVQADRFTQISASSGTFLVRLLYDWDVLPAILSHPFGIGYMGYPAIMGTIQTGRYAVTYLHNELLQLLLEIGWIPTALLAWALVRVLVSKQHTPKRLMLLAVLAHCMLDFDLQFGAFWMLLVCCLDLTQGKCHSLSRVQLAGAVGVLLLLPSLWLGIGDWLYRQGKVDACLTVTPFHTNALASKLTTASDAAQVDALADKILANNPTHSLAHSAKANVALAKGDVLSMIQYKEDAIRYAPYTLDEYCDYFQKLYQVMNLYLQARDLNSAAFCRDKLLEIPEMMEAVARRTTPLAYRTGDDPSLVLPPEYLSILEILPHAF